MALHAKAKAEAGYRFYALYDKLSREDILAHAYAQCRSNKGAPGVDGQDFADVEAYGVDRWLAELALALRQEAYQPAPIRRVFIPKANGKLRPLGISTLRDRVCMTAAMLVLEPIFEADLPPELYAYRPGRNAQQAVVEVEELLFRGHPEVVDADLADYFGSIPHAELLKSVSRRIVDRRVLHLIRMWLDCPVEETDDRGRKTRTTEARDKRRGIPQGSPISPLLANIYMRRFVLAWKMFGLERSLGSRLVTYADDLVILCRRGKAEDALQRMREVMSKLKLTVNEEKTRICKVPEGEFDFLTLQLRFDMSAFCMSLVGASPKRPGDDEVWSYASSRQARGYAADFLDRPTDQGAFAVKRRAILALRRIVFGGGATALA